MIVDKKAFVFIFILFFQISFCSSKKCTNGNHRMILCRTGVFSSIKQNDMLCTHINEHAFTLGREERMPFQINMLCLLEIVNINDLRLVPAARCSNCTLVKDASEAVGNEIFMQGFNKKERELKKLVYAIFRIFKNKDYPKLYGLEDEKETLRNSVLAPFFCDDKWGKNRLILFNSRAMN